MTVFDLAPDADVDQLLAAPELAAVNDVPVAEHDAAALIDRLRTPTQTSCEAIRLALEGN